MRKKIFLSVAIISCLLGSMGLFATSGLQQQSMSKQTTEQGQSRASSDDPWDWGDECETNEDCDWYCFFDEWDDCDNDSIGFCEEGVCYWYTN